MRFCPKKRRMPTAKRRFNPLKEQVFESDFGAEYVKATLDCGLEIYVMEKPGYNSSYAIFGTKYGSVDMNFAGKDGKRVNIPAGTAHFLEHKLFESEDGDAFSKYAKTGASANAFTSFDRTCYLFSCGDRFYENFDILLDFVQSPYFTSETVNKEQGIIGQEIRMYDDSPSWRVLFNMLENMYFESPVKTDIAGTVESIAQIDAGVLYKCYETFYNPSNMFICVCGNVDAARVIETVKKSIRSVISNPVVRFESAEPEKVKSHFTEQKLAVLVPMFCLGFKQNDGELYKNLKERVCMSLLLETAAGECSPLYARLTREGLIGDGFATEHFVGRGYSAVIFEGESEFPEKVRDEILLEFENIRENGIDKRLFSAAKHSLYGDAIRRLNSVESVCMQFTECAISGFELFDEIKVLKAVTSDDIYRRLDVFTRSNAVLSVVKPQEEQ